jgi:hypothetical protein
MKRRRALFLSFALLLGGCGGGSTTPTAPSTPAPSPTPRNLRADVTDRVGDAGAFAGVAVSPDLLSGSVEITQGNLMLISVRCNAATFDPATTFIQFDLDVDQNPVTGSPVEGLGLDYIIDMGSSFYAGQARVSRFVGGTEYQAVANVPISVVANGIDVGVPLSLIGNDDGRMNFRVISSTYLGGNGFSTILDYMPDRTVPGAVVQ